VMGFISLSFALIFCRIRLPVGEHRPGFGDRRGDDPVGCPDIGIFS